MADVQNAQDGVTFADFAHELGPKKRALANAVRAHLGIARSSTALHSREKLHKGLADLMTTTTDRKAKK